MHLLFHLFQSNLLQAPNLGGGLYQNNRTGGVDSCIFANNTVTLSFSGQVSGTTHAR